MNKETKQKVAQASSGLKKLTPEQEKAILKLFETQDARFEQVKKIVHKSILYKITGSIEFAPKSTRNERAEELNKLLFS